MSHSLPRSASAFVLSRIPMRILWLNYKYLLTPRMEWHDSVDLFCLADENQYREERNSAKVEFDVSEGQGRSMYVLQEAHFL